MFVSKVEKYNKALSKKYINFQLIKIPYFYIYKDRLNQMRLICIKYHCDGYNRSEFSAVE